MSFQENVKSNSLIVALDRIKSSQLTWISGFALLMVMAAQVSIPVEPVPFTLHTMIVLLSGAFLGARNGAISQVLYVAAGVAGLPVFANFSFGPAVLFGTTGGYLLAFPVAAYLVGSIVENRKSLLAISTAMVTGAAVILLSGAAYLSLFFGGDFKEAFFAGVLIFTVWDVIKISAAISIYYAFSKKYPKLPA